MNGPALTTGWQELTSHLQGALVGHLGSWASILGVFIALFTMLRVSKMVRVVEEDRNGMQGIQNPVDIYFHILQAEALLEKCRREGRLQKSEDGEFSRVVRGLHVSATSLESYFHIVDGPRSSGGKVFLCAARHHAARGEAGKAALYFEKALEHSRIHPRLSRSELAECLSGLRRCYLALWNSEGVLRVEREAGNKKLAILKSEPGVRIELLCIGEHCKYAVRALFTILRIRRRPRTRMITTP